MGIKYKKILETTALSLFYLFFWGLFLFGGKFAHININLGFSPLYITEFFIFIFIIILSFNFKFYGKDTVFAFKFQKIEYILLVLVFLISLIRGISLYDAIFSLRQAAIIYYCVFYFITAIILNKIEKIYLFITLLFISSLFVSSAFLFGYKLYGVGDFGYYYSAIALILLFFLMPKLKNKSSYVLFIIMALTFFANIVFNMVRAVWVAIGIAFIFYLLLFIFTPKLKRSLLKILIALGIFLLILIIFSSIFFILKPSKLEIIKEEFTSIFNFSNRETLSEINAGWRVEVWKDMINKVMVKPFLGYSFGNVYNYDYYFEGFVDPHNSFISIAYRTGFIGLAIFIGLIIAFFTKSIRFINRNNNENINILIAGFLASIVFILAASFFMVVLEGPFLGILLWVDMGIVVSIINYGKNYAPNCISP